MQGIGASLSGLAAGEIVDHFGYGPAFLSLGATALVALIFFTLGMPETGTIPSQDGSSWPSKKTTGGRPFSDAVRQRFNPNGK